MTWLLLLFLIAETKLDRPIQVDLFVHDDSGTVSKITGKLTRYDDFYLVVKTATDEQQYAWTDLTATSAYAVRARLIDRNDAKQWLELGRFAWSIQATDQARIALAKAAELDPSLKTAANDVLKEKPGEALRAATQPTTRPQLLTSIDDAKSQFVRFQKSTPEQDKEAIAAAKRQAEEVQTTLKVRFSTVETTHFIIFTDWDQRESAFLKTNLEGAYAAVSKQFDIPVKENVFVGKLPVFMLATRKEFQEFADKVDEAQLPGGIVMGYYAGRDDGVGHLVMWKPDATIGATTIQAAEIQWAYVLTHEFTHAFAHRYRTNRDMPRWLHEGIAEVIASHEFPQARPNATMQARIRSQDRTTISQLFDPDFMPGADWYPVMRTMVEALVARDRTQFLAMFNDMKDGMKPEKALQKHFGIDYGGLEQLWRQYASRL